MTGASQYLTVRLCCHAPSPDPRRRDQVCDNVLGDVPGPVRFVGTSARRSHVVDGRIRLQCSRASCRTWNVFEAILPDGSPVPHRNGNGTHR